MNAADPFPPWVLEPGVHNEAFWLECGRPHVRSTWRPFWDALTEGERIAHLDRFPPPPSWGKFLEDVAFDQEVARIDAEDIASGVLQPNGSQWPLLHPARPPWWRRLLRLR